MADKLAEVINTNGTSLFNESTPVVTNPDEQWSIVVTFANLGERNKFLAAANKYAETGDCSPMFPYCARFIKKWPYASNPSVVGNYDNLTTDQWDEEVQPRLIKAMEIFRR